MASSARQLWLMKSSAVSLQETRRTRLRIKIRSERFAELKAQRLGTLFQLKYFHPRRRTLGWQTAIVPHRPKNHRLPGLAHRSSQVEQVGLRQ